MTGEGFSQRELLLEVRNDVKLLMEKMGIVDFQGDQIKDHESRIRSLERKVYILATAAAVGGGSAATIAQQIWGV